MEEARIVIAGAGAAGLGVARLLVTAGARRLVVCDRAGAIHRYRPTNMNWAKAEVARMTNRDVFEGSLDDALRGADVFVGLSAGNILRPEAVSRMAENPIVFALAVPTPEIMPAEAKKVGARIVATGRSDFPNQLDIALVFPGVLRGLLDVQAYNVTADMLLAAADALAGLVPEDERSPERIVRPIFDFRVAPTLAAAVARADGRGRGPEAGGPRGDRGADPVLHLRGAGPSGAPAARPDPHAERGSPGAAPAVPREAPGREQGPHPRRPHHEPPVSPARGRPPRPGYLGGPEQGV